LCATAFDVVGWGKVKNEGILTGREACPGVVDLRVASWRRREKICTRRGALSV